MAHTIGPHDVMVDLGNSRLKLGRFARAVAAAGLPAPHDVCVMPLSESMPLDLLAPWRERSAQCGARWVIASVNTVKRDRLREWTGQNGRPEVVVIEDPRVLPLKVHLPEPQKVGIDRLMNAVAANVIRPENRPAIVIDAGSAVTVDAVSAEGAFLGGAILAGADLQARALSQFTEKLPLLDVAALGREAPVLGTNTPAAMLAGLVWGGVGAVNELIDRLSDGLPAEPLVLLTGGGATLIADRLRRPIRWVPHLTLQGICLAYHARARTGASATG
ncbi:MAG: type III pantothenate kinase [Pirellulales bacterium]